jgi:hypothetical protein
MARYTAKVPGFGKQSSSVGAYTSADNSRTNPLADDQLMSKATDNRSVNKDLEAYSIGRTQDDTPRPQVQSHGHGSKEG